jgi:hypothetical protein
VNAPTAVAAACDDGLFCNGSEGCDPAAGTCTAGTAPCTADQTCDEATDTCSDAAPCPNGTDAECDDGNLCTTDTCVELQCVNTAVDCDDDLFCTGTESCDAATGACVSTGDPCDPDTQACDEATDSCVASTTLTLTDEIDVLNGTAGNDNFIASDDTYDTGDTLDGRGGTDSLNLTTTAAEGDLVDSTAIELVFIRNTQNNNSIDLDGFQGFTQLWYNRGNQELTLTNVHALATVGMNGGDGGDSDFTVEFDDELCEGTEDSLNVELEDADGGTLTVQGDGTEGFETLNVNLTGDSTLDGLVSADLETVNFTGASSIVIAGAIGNAETVTATGDIDVEITADDVDFTYTGGAGTDIVNFGEGEFNEDDSVDGGAGDADEVNVALDASLNQPVTIENTEILGVQGDDDGSGETFTFDLGGVEGLATVRVESLGAGSTADTITLDDMNLGPAFYFRGDGTDANQVFDNITIDFVGAGGGSDTLGLTIDNRGDDGEDLEDNDRTVTLATLDLDDIEELSITNNDGGTTTITTINGTDLEALTIVSGTDLTITNALESTSVESIDASGSAGDISVSAANSTVAVNIVGGSGNDTLTGGTGSDAIDGGDDDADDTITGGAGDDDITTGDGSDTVVGTTVGGSSANADIVNDFTNGSGGDIFAFDLSALETDGSIDVGEVIDFTELADGTSVAAADAITIHECTVGAACTPAANSNVIVMIGGTIATTAALETALEDGGGTELAIHADAGDVTSAFPVVYTDGNNGFVAICFAETETTNDTDFDTTDLVCVNVAELEDIDSIATGDFVAANFDYID